MPRQPTNSKRAHADDLREVLLDTANTLYRREGGERLGMREVAREAGVARSTLYRYFAKRDDLLLAMVEREIEASAAQIAAGLEGVRKPEDHIVEGIVLALRDLPKRKLLMDLLVSDAFPLRRNKAWSSDGLVALGHGFMHGVLERAKEEGRLRDGVRVELLEEWVYRVLLSLLTLPTSWSRNEKQLRRTLHQLLIPVLIDAR